MDDKKRDLLLAHKERMAHKYDHVEDKEAYAEVLQSSPRGALILSQALYLAIKEMEARPLELQEPSNVADMKLLLEHYYSLYSPYVAVAEAMEAAKAAIKEGTMSNITTESLEEALARTGRSSGSESSEG